MIEIAVSWVMHPRNWGVGWGKNRINTEDASEHGALPTTAYSMWLGPLGAQLTVYYLGNGEV